MALSGMANIVLRGFQFLWTLLILAIVGNMIASAFGGNPSIINYDMFVAVFSMLSLFYLIPTTFRDSFIVHPMIMVAVDALNALFFLIGGIAMAAILRVHSCSDSDYTKNNSITNGASDRGKRCREGQAVTAFLWFGFAAYLGSTILSALSSRGSGASLRGGGIRRGGPSMSQV
ncbi:MAG: hypothetical protein M4579_005196 [Chaenotheca gracillima]|nr:MAG: hypothetical protein M4579_005196 [Chaenotheca gracillima]